MRIKLAVFIAAYAGLLFSITQCGAGLLPDVTNLVGDNLDELVVKGVTHIRDTGERFEARAGSGQQAYETCYTLLNPLNRTHELRGEKALRYFCRELLAYFRGSLDVDEGLSHASKFWKGLAGKDNQIASNYGHYVFHQRLPRCDNMTQYEWVIFNLMKNLHSRKAFININQPWHKAADTKDYPCTIGLQFFVRNGHLCCTVSSRSTDIYTGLPYDMGFFSFVAELVHKDLQQRLAERDGAACAEELKLGYVMMKSNFTQIYDKTRDYALKLIEKHKQAPAYSIDMPEISDAQAVLKDIYRQTSHTPVLKWIHKHAKGKTRS